MFDFEVFEFMRLFCRLLCVLLVSNCSHTYFAYSNEIVLYSMYVVKQLSVQVCTACIERSDTAQLGRSATRSKRLLPRIRKPVSSAEQDDAQLEPQNSPRCFLNLVVLQEPSI